MLVGIDFDNTIAGYDHVFADAAIERGLVERGFAGAKRDVREAVRRLPDGERRWMALQGEVYGPRMGQARMLPGVDSFLLRCREAGFQVTVISHKTETGHFDPTGTNLRTAALAWMKDQGLFDALGVSLARVFFESTREEKIARIAGQGCDLFIDDLEEVLTDPAFPAGCRRLHLAGAAEPAGHGGLPFASFRTWQEIGDAVFR